MARLLETHKTYPGSYRTWDDTPLTVQLAQRIVARANVGLESALSVTHTSGRILASSDQPRVGRVHPLAVRAIAASALAECPCADGGVSLPLLYKDTMLGAIIVHDTPARARHPTLLISSLAELVIHQEIVIERLPLHDRLRDRFLGDLLHGRLSPDTSLAHAAAVFDIDLAQPRTVVALNVGCALDHLAPRHAADASPAVTHARQLAHARAALHDCVTRARGLVESDIVGVVDEGWMVVLATIDPRNSERSRANVAVRVQRCLEDVAAALHVAVSAGIGRYYEGHERLAQSFADARFASETGARLYGAGRVYTLRELGLVSLLGDLDEQTKEELANRLIQPLAREPGLLATLVAFLRHDLSPSRSAEELSIHRHTLAYRLDKIERLTGLDPRRLDGATQLYAALLLLRVSGLLTGLLDNWP